LKALTTTCAFVLLAHASNRFTELLFLLELVGTPSLTFRFAHVIVFCVAFDIINA